MRIPSFFVRNFYLRFLFRNARTLVLLPIAFLTLLTAVSHHATARASLQICRVLTSICITHEILSNCKIINRCIVRIGSVYLNDLVPMCHIIEFLRLERFIHQFESVHTFSTDI
ncbi:hypothetical protein NY2A_b269R [Paramecium bursaria Chlorella virus NY2A]|uniref:Uncharacterized protein b269R n=1 Tax=Paramecium bursaria Chlorella virus NY2A TaxID=46021 RepID=A7IWE4_PBCVN|nr:hypothetical protein NY2A_b269R [Paramecium bursaria Chlorella virus NY2A]ABT14668.1 hypothetical protein NY2A_b269R [Paramecium bursaria Chlorella virus NY2A]